MIWENVRAVNCLLDPKTPAFTQFVERPCRQKGIHLNALDPRSITRIADLEAADTLVASPAVLAALLLRGIDFRQAGIKTALLGGSILPAWMVNSWPQPKIFEILADSARPQVIYARDARHEAGFKRIYGGDPGETQRSDTNDIILEREDGFYFSGSSAKTINGQFITGLERFLDGLYPQIYAFKIEMTRELNLFEILLNNRNPAMERQIENFCESNYGLQPNFRLLTPENIDYSYGKRVIFT